MAGSLGAQQWTGLTKRPLRKVLCKRVPHFLPGVTTGMYQHSKERTMKREFVLPLSQVTCLWSVGGWASRSPGEVSLAGTDIQRDCFVVCSSNLQCAGTFTRRLPAPGMAQGRGLWGG